MNLLRKPYRGQGGVNPRTFVGRQMARGMFSSEFHDAEDMGRRMAMAHMSVDPVARARVEATFGLPYCHNRYPELYASRPRRWFSGLA